MSTRAASLVVNQSPPRGRVDPGAFVVALPRLARNLASRRVLLGALVWRDLKAKYQALGLGYVWSLLNPLILLLVYGWVFSTVLRVQSEHFVLFLAAGLLPWIWTAESLSTGTGSIVNNAGMVRRIHFPVEVLPISAVTSHFIHFLLSLPILFAALLLVGRGPQVYVLALPLVMGAHFCLNSGLALVTSILNVQFRDLQYIVSNALVFLVFAAPIIYPVSQVPEQYRSWLMLNPFTPIVTSYQDILFYNRWPHWTGDLALAWGVSLLVLWIGAVVADRHRWSAVEEL